MGKRRLKKRALVSAALFLQAPAAAPLCFGKTSASGSAAEKITSVGSFSRFSAGAFYDQISYKIVNIPNFWYLDTVFNCIVKVSKNNLF